MDNNNFAGYKEQYMVEPKIIDKVNFEDLEKQIDERLLHSLKDLKEVDFAKIIFMTPQEFKLVTVKIELYKVWSVIKKMKTNVV
jgi:hypothetical protein